MNEQPQTPEQRAAFIAEFLRKVKVKSVEECAKSEFHVCSERPTGLKGEQESVCAICGKPVFFTQVFPKDGPQPKKACMPCVISHAAGEDAFGA